MKLVSEMKREFVCLVGEAYGLSGLNSKHRKAALVLEVEATMRLTPCDVCGGPCKPEVHAFDISQPPFSTSSLLSPLSFQESDEEIDEHASISNSGSIANTDVITAAASSQTPMLQTQDVLGAGFVASASTTLGSTGVVPTATSPPSMISSIPASVSSSINTSSSIFGFTSSVHNHGLLRHSPNLPGGMRVSLNSEPRTSSHASPQITGFLPQQPGAMRVSLDSGSRTSNSHLSSQAAGFPPQHFLGSYPHHHGHPAGQATGHPQGQGSSQPGQFVGQIPGQFLGHYPGQAPNLGFNQPNLAPGQSPMFPSQMLLSKPNLGLTFP